MLRGDVFNFKMRILAFFTYGTLYEHEREKKMKRMTNELLTSFEGDLRMKAMTSR
jgi:hypothetical protein